MPASFLDVPAARRYTRNDALNAIRAFSSETGIAAPIVDLVEAGPRGEGAFRFNGVGLDFCQVRFLDDDGSVLVSYRSGNRSECRRVRLRETDRSE